MNMYHQFHTTLERTYERQTTAKLLINYLFIGLDGLTL